MLGTRSLTVNRGVWSGVWFHTQSALFPESLPRCLPTCHAEALSQPNHHLGPWHFWWTPGIHSHLSPLYAHSRLELLTHLSKHGAPFSPCLRILCSKVCPSINRAKEASILVFLDKNCSKSDLVISTQSSSPTLPLKWYYTECASSHHIPRHQNLTRNSSW